MPRSTPHLGAWTVIPASPSWGDAGAERALDNNVLGGVTAVSWCEHEGRVTSSRRQGEFSPFGLDAESRTLFDSPHETRSTSLASSPGSATASASAHRRGSRGSADVAVGSPWIRKDGGVEVVGIRAAAQTLACLFVPRVPGFGHHPLLAHILASIGRALPARFRSPIRALAPPRSGRVERFLARLIEVVGDNLDHCYSSWTTPKRSPMLRRRPGSSGSCG